MKRILQALALAVVMFWLAGGAYSATFSEASLNGSCIWQIFGLSTTTGDQTDAGPLTTLFWATFDGTGNVTIDFDININGAFSSTPPVAGTYSVDPNGHGDLSFVSPVTNQTVEADFFITPKGQAILTQTRGFGNQVVTPWVSNGICNFDE